VLGVPGQDVVADRRGQGQVFKEPVDAVLVDRDVLGAEPVEVSGGVLPVVGQQGVGHQIADVQDGPVDVEHDAELAVGIGPAHALVVHSELPHPVGAWSLHCHPLQIEPEPDGIGSLGLRGWASPAILAPFPRSSPSCREAGWPHG
jgi:hypothetical protein